MKKLLQLQSSKQSGQDPDHTHRFEPTARLSMPSDKLLIEIWKIYFLFRWGSQTVAGMILKSLKSLLNSPGAKLAFSLQQFHLGGRFKERAVKGIPFPCHPSAEALLPPPKSWTNCTSYLQTKLPRAAWIWVIELFLLAQIYLTQLKHLKSPEYLPDCRNLLIKQRKGGALLRDENTICSRSQESSTVTARRTVTKHTLTFAAGEPQTHPVWVRSVILQSMAHTVANKGLSAND